MSSKARRGGADRAKETGEDGNVVDRKMIETIREATGATEDDIRVMLFECNFDANETTSRLIDNPFSQVQSKKEKKKKREEDRKKEPPAKVVEVRRSASQGSRSRGHERDRSSRSERSDRLPDRGSKPYSAAPVVAPEKQTIVSTEPSAPGGWDSITSGDVETDVPSTSTAGGDASVGALYASAWAPSAPPSQPSAIQPPSSAIGGKRSMADLFKKPQDVAPAIRPAPVGAPPSASSLPKQPTSDSLEPNGWGTSHSNDLESLRQGGSLGGVAVSAPLKPQASQPSLSASPRTLQQPVGSLSHVPSSPGNHSHLDEQVLAPSTTGLGGVPVEAPPRQYADSQSQPSWVPKASAAPGHGSQPTLGSSILSSLGVSGASVPSSAPPRVPDDPLALQNLPDLQLGSSAFGTSPVKFPPSAQQGNNEIGGLSFQFGNFGMSSSGPDLGASYGSNTLHSGFEPSVASQSPSSQPLSTQASSEAFRQGSYSQPQNNLPASEQQSQILRPQQQQQQTQQQQQRAYNAFTSAVQPQVSQRPAASATPEVSGPVSQGLYANPAYSNYASSHAYGQQQQQQAAAPTQPSQYQNYGFHTPELEQAAASVGVSHQQPAASGAPKRPAGFDATSYTAYAQGQGAGKDFPVAKYGNSGLQAHHLGAAGGAPSSVQSAAALASQNPLSQITGYGAGVGGMAPQGYNYGAQQPYGNYAPQYNSFANHPGNSYGYNAGSQSGYQAGNYGAGNSSYGQSGKYGRNYAGSGGGSAYQQHAGGYAPQAHKQEKEHQAAHLGGHDIYGQQLPLGAQQHYQAAGMRDASSYGYTNPTQGYGGYGRQYNQPYYGRDQ